MQIKPFSALYYDPKKAEAAIQNLVSPPYDVIGAELEQELKSCQYNVINILFGKENHTYDLAAERLSNWIGKGVLKNDAQECLYVYEQTFNALGNEHVRTALVSVVKLEPYEHQVILPHEATLPKHIDDRYRLLDATQTNTGMIFMIYDDPESVVDSEMEKAKTKPVYEFVDFDGITHRIFRIFSATSIGKITRILDDRKAVIADGHHRYETSLRYQKDFPEVEGTSYIMSALVNVRNPGLIVLPTHRLLYGIEQSKVDALEKNLEKNFDLNYCNSEKELLEALENAADNSIGFWLPPNKFFIATAKEEFINKELPQNRPLNTLEVTLLHEAILPTQLGLDKEKQAAHAYIDYVKGTDEAIIKMNSGRYQVGTFLRTVKAGQVLQVAASGDKMPQKSTYFFPKFWSGLLMRKLSTPSNQ